MSWNRFSGFGFVSLLAAFGSLGPACSQAEKPRPPGAQATTVVAALNASPKSSDFIFEAGNSIVLHSSPLTVNGGDVGARGTGSGPFLSGSVAIDISSGAVVQTTHNLIADSIRLNSGVKVGDLQVSRLVNPSSGTHGSVTPLVPLPALPAPAAVAPGTTNLTVAGGKTVTASPGQFLTVSLGTGGVLRLNAGTYQIKDLTIGTSGRVEALGTVQIRIANRLNAGSSFFIGPASGTALTAKDIRVEVSGVNGTDGALGSTPKAAALASGGSIEALVLVPNGTLTFASGICAKGAFQARDIDVGSSNAAYTFEDGFPNAATCTPAGCDDHNPCTADTCGATGACTHTSLAANTSCSDGDACNGVETCDGAGVCRSGTPVTCKASDVCHVAGTCDPATGNCSNPPAPKNTPCGDGDACNGTETCDGAGACKPGMPITCTPSDQCHDVGTCNPSTGACSNPAKPDGSTCSDGNACTTGDSCQAGACASGPAVAVDDHNPCTADSCDPAVGVLHTPTLAGSSCSDGDACNGLETCNGAGLCIGGTPVVCQALDVCHDIGACDPSTGVCSNPNKADGSSCDDGNACTTSDACHGGACSGTTVTCTAQDQCHVAGSCDQTTGKCSTPNKTDGTTCDDANPCTIGDACHGGTCSGTTVTCTAQDQCHAAGSCDPGTGGCSNPTKADGSSCDDGNACTTGDACQGGACTPGANTCPSIAVQQEPSPPGVVTQLAATVSTDRTAPFVPGDAAEFSATVTNTGIFYEHFGFLTLTNNGTAPFTVGAYQHTLDYFDSQTHSWVSFAKTAVDSSGNTVIDPTLPSIDIFGTPFGAVLQPGEARGFFYIPRANIPGDITKVIFDPTVATQWRSHIHFDTGPGTPGIDSALDISSTFTNASPEVTNATALLIFDEGFGGPQNRTTLSAATTDIGPGDSVVFTGIGVSPAFPPRDPNESSQGYLSDLAFAHLLTEFRVTVLADASGVPANPNEAVAQLMVPWRFPLVSATKSGPAQATAGLTLPYTVTLQNFLDGPASVFVATDTVNGTDIGATVTGYPSTLAPGASATITVNAPTPLGQAPGPYTDTVHVTWQDSNGNVYGPVDSSFSTNVVAGHPEGYLTLSNSGAPSPQMLGTPLTLTATALDGLGNPVPNVAVQLVITGNNPQTVSLVTGGNGTASFTYNGPNLGRDTATATATINGPPLQATVSTIDWASSVGPPCTGQATPLDIVMVIDGSPSTFTPDNLGTAQATTDAFLADLDFSRDQIGFEIFSNDQPLDAHMTTDPVLAKSEIDFGLFAAANACDGFCAGGTNMAAGLVAGLAELQSPRHRPGATPLMVVLSDGNTNQGDTASAVAAVKASGIRVISIGMGSNINLALMLQVASSPNDFFATPNTAELSWAYSNVGNDACRNTAPLVSAGGNQGLYEVRLPATLTLQGEAHGAGPRGDLALTSTWTEVSGPAPVTFADASSPVTSVLFTDPGTYVLQLEASDGILTSADRATITVDPAQSLAGASLVAALSSPGPLSTGTPETLTALLIDATAQPISNFVVEVTVTGANPTTAVLTTNASGVATFSYTGAKAGTDVLQATAFGASAQLAAAPLSLAWTLAGPAAAVSQGWIGSPGQQSMVKGLVPVTVAAGVTVASGTLSYWPATSPADIHTLTSSAAGGPGATLATLDTTTLKNGSYILDLDGADSDGHHQESAILVTVTGDYKPGREVVTVTEFTVPIAGIPITVGRTYDSLNKDTVGDFGNGWSLTVGHPDLQVDQGHNVTITLPNGRRATFQFAMKPIVVAAGPLAIIFNFLVTPVYLPEPGVFGSLTSDGCAMIAIDVNNPDPLCFGAFDASEVQYAPTTYKYTDAYGTVYTMGADGTLKSIQDRSNNTLIFTPGGITASTGGVNVQFARDAQGRITKLLTPAMGLGVLAGNFVPTYFEYDYTYDVAGNLATATAPPQNIYVEQTTYTYDASHLLLTTKDPAGNMARTSTFDAAGRLATDKDAMGNVTSYAYDVPGHTTTTTYPDTGVLAETFDDNGMLLSQTDQLGRVTKHAFDANRNEIKRTNALGDVTTFGYDTNGNQTSSKNALGETTTTTYNAFSEPLTTTNPIGNTTTNAYDANGATTSSTDSMGPLATYTSSEHGQPLTVTDAAGKTVYLTYDAAGDLAGQVDRLGRFIGYQYDPMGRKTSMTDPRGGVTTYSYDNDSDLLSSIAPASPPGSRNPEGFGPLYHFDANRNVKEVTTVHQVFGTNVAASRTDQFTYDANNHLIKTFHTHDQTEIDQTVDFRGNVLTRTDEAGHKSSYSYDLAGHLVQTTNPDGTSTKQTYDELGRLASKTDERGNTTTYAYEPGCDCGKRLTSVTDPLGRTTSMTYDGMGRKTSMTDANGHQTSYAYDLRGHLIETDYADGTATHDTFDALGRRTASADQTGATMRYGYDAEGELTSVTDPLGNVTHYAYDASGNLTSVTDANNHTTTYAYDPANRKVSRTLPLGMTETFGYDDDSNATSHTDFRGKTTTYGFDDRRPGRPTSKVPDPSLGEPTVTFAYNPTSTRSTMTDASGATTYTYDLRNQLLTKATPEGTLTYTYDAGGNVASIDSSNTNGISVSYAWDAANQLATVTDNRLGKATTATYTATGRPKGIVQPNDVRVVYEYDSLDRVTSVSWNRGTADPFASWAYAYSQRGQRVSSTELTGRKATYGYDAASRLASETITSDPDGASKNGAVTYVIDPAGNRLSRASTLGALGAQSFACDANDELTSDGYDLSGNTTSSNGHTYAYDFENRLVSMDGGTVTLLYDGDGNRVAKTVGGVMTEYLVDDKNPTGDLQVMEEVSGGGVQVRYTLGNMLVSETRNVSATPVTNFYGYDAHRNIAFLTDSAGDVTDTYKYDAWGNIVAREGTTGNSRLYAGQEFDSDLGLLNLRARQYEPTTGRFLTLDPLTGEPLKPTSFNRYLYAGADPVNRWDPKGQADLIEWLTVERFADIITIATLQLIKEQTSAKSNRFMTIINKNASLDSIFATIAAATAPGTSVAFLGFFGSCLVSLGVYELQHSDVEHAAQPVPWACFDPTR